MQLPDGTVIDGDQVTSVYEHTDMVCCDVSGDRYYLEPVGAPGWEGADPHQQVRDWAARLMGRSPKKPIARTR